VPQLRHNIRDHHGALAPWSRSAVIAFTSQRRNDQFAQTLALQVPGWEKQLCVGEGFSGGPLRRHARKGPTRCGSVRPGSCKVAALVAAEADPRKPERQYQYGSFQCITDIAHHGRATGCHSHRFAGRGPALRRSSDSSVQPPPRRSLPDMSNHVFSRWTRPPSGMADVESEVVVGGEAGRSGSAEHGYEGVVVVVYFDIDLARMVAHDPPDVLKV